MKQVTMPYSEYKKLYGKYKKVYDSYNKKDKTIIVELPDEIEYKPVEREPWLEILISENNVEYFGDSVMIKLPYKSTYRKHIIWVSRKLVKASNGKVRLICKPDFRFKARSKIDEVELCAEDLAEIFNIRLSEQEEPEIHTPEALEPCEPKILEELKDEY